ncbi:hypothetical protein [Sulfuricaulis sp.]|jgi:hypothetical protein|uniref:hypothetical protein n=1 Tax=Sulfuricaulis sp. TaxID=2003553 RepID=UPI00355A9C53
MSEAVHKKLNIACEYMDMAMQLYVEERNYFCAIHLAAAAEELLGMHLPEDKRISNVACKAQKALRIIETGKAPENTKANKKADKEAKRIVNFSKNTIKHMKDPKDTDDTTIIIDPAFEAAHWIEQALINFYKLDLSKSPTLWKFEDYRNKQIRQELGSLL